MPATVIEPGRTSANLIVAGSAVIHKLTRPSCAGASRSLMNNCETDIRMLRTGPLRRSSTPVRKKAIVDKSRIEAGCLRSPRSVFVALVSPVDFVPFLGGVSRQKSLLTGRFLRDVCPQEAEGVLVNVTS